MQAPSSERPGCLLYSTKGPKNGPEGPENGHRGLRKDLLGIFFPEYLQNVRKASAALQASTQNAHPLRLQISAGA